MVYGLNDHTHRASEVGAAEETHYHYDYERDLREQRDAQAGLRHDLYELRNELSGHGDNVGELLDRIERYSLEAQEATGRVMQRVTRIEEILSIPHLDQSEEQEASTRRAMGEDI